MTSARDLADGRPPEFAVEPADLSGAPGVVLHGDVDLSVAQQLTEALEAAIRESVGAFVIDLGDVTFLDSSGVNVILRARATLGRDERALAVVCPPGPARRVFEVAGIADLLELFDSREHAAASLQPAR
jgi:anti-sigma B factor antagonist